MLIRVVCLCSVSIILHTFVIHVRLRAECKQTSSCEEMRFPVSGHSTDTRVSITLIE